MDTVSKRVSRCESTSGDCFLTSIITFVDSDDATVDFRDVRMGGPRRPTNLRRMQILGVSAFIHFSSVFELGLLYAET